MTFLAPPPPSQPTDGNVGGGGGTPLANGAMLILIRINTNASHLLDSNGVAHPIPDGTYICLAKYWPVTFNLDDSGFLLFDRNSGTTYLVNDQGYREPLFSGQDNSDCFASTQLVWDWVTDAELLNIKPDPSVAAIGCGPWPIQGG